MSRQPWQLSHRDWFLRLREVFPRQPCKKLRGSYTHLFLSTCRAVSHSARCPEQRWRDPLASMSSEFIRFITALLMIPRITLLTAMERIQGFLFNGIDRETACMLGVTVPVAELIRLNFLAKAAMVLSRSLAAFQYELGGKSFFQASASWHALTLMKHDIRRMRT